MVGNYTNIDGVKVQEWSANSEPSEPDNEFIGEIEEMYWDFGSLKIDITHPDGETMTAIEVPIKAKKDWNEFVESLPTWDL